MAYHLKSHLLRREKAYPSMHFGLSSLVKEFSPDSADPCSDEGIEPCPKKPSAKQFHALNRKLKKRETQFMNILSVFLVQQKQTWEGVCVTFCLHPDLIYKRLFVYTLNYRSLSWISKWVCQKDKNPPFQSNPGQQFACKDRKNTDIMSNENANSLWRSWWANYLCA